MKDEGDVVWSVVMFDLPTLSREQRRLAHQFRMMLLDLGFQRAQLSVYVRYTPTMAGIASAVRSIKFGLPPQGEVRILQVTDRQWSKMISVHNGERTDTESRPQTLTLF